MLLLVAAVLGFVGSPPGALAAPAPAQGSLDGPRFVELTVSSVSPRTVTADTAAVTVRGTLRNTGDRPVTDLDVRLQRAPAVATADELGSALRTVPETFDSTGPFERVADELDPGGTVEFTLALPTTGRTGSSLALDEPGVYPVLVNVNGTPDFGEAARLDAAHLLLPVQAVPAGATPPTSPAPPALTTPPSVTVLWPLADRPRLLPTDAGAPPLLTDDDLAASLATGGRLDGLLDAATAATAPAADAAGELGRSLCLAVDPDLLATAEAMTTPGGYRVRTPTGSTDGTGAAAAAAWLDELRAAATETCVTALPWAQADLNAAARAGLDVQSGLAVTGAAAEVARVVGVDTLPGLTWPTGGALTDGAAAGLAAQGQTALVLAADALDGTQDARAVRVAAGSASLGAAVLDPATSTALAATGSEPAAVAGDPATTDRTTALQDAIGALSWPSLVRAGVDDDGQPVPPGAPGTLLVAPPQSWSADDTEAAALLEAVAALLAADLATPQPLTTLVSAAASATTTATLDYPVRAAAAEVPTATTDAVSRAVGALAGFTASTSADVQAGVEPDTLTAPLQQDLVRSLSTAPGAPPAGGVAAVLAALLSQVELQAPGGPYTLASESSPLLLVVRNGLPVAVDVRIAVTGPPGLSVTDIGVQQLPASSTRQLMLPTSVGRTGQFAVDVTLSTASGQSTGPSTRVLVRSTAYGTATAAVTGAAAVLLLLLVARRLWHRFRGQPDPADEGRLLP